MMKTSIINIIFAIILNFICFNLNTQKLNDSTSIIKYTKDKIVIKRFPNQIIIVEDKRIINDLNNDAAINESDSIHSTFFVDKIIKYKTHYIITVIGDNNKYYEIMSPRKFHLFGRKIKVGGRYFLKLYPYYKKDYINEIINYSEKQQSYHFIYKENIINVEINGTNIYTTPNLNDIYYNSQCGNSENLKFNIDSYIDILIKGR